MCLTLVFVLPSLSGFEGNSFSKRMVDDIQIGNGKEIFAQNFITPTQIFLLDPPELLVHLVGTPQLNTSLIIPLTCIVTRSHQLWLRLRQLAV